MSKTVALNLFGSGVVVFSGQVVCVARDVSLRERRSCESPFVASEHAEDVTRHASLHRCTRCGACDAQLAVEDAWDYALVGPPSMWVRTLAKSHARWPELAGVLACAPKSGVRAMEQRCPVDVPFLALREQAVIDRPKPPPKKVRKREDPG